MKVDNVSLFDRIEATIAYTVPGSTSDAKGLLKFQKRGFFGYSTIASAPAIKVKISPLNSGWGYNGWDLTWELGNGMNFRHVERGTFIKYEQYSSYSNAKKPSEAAFRYHCKRAG